MSGFRVPKRRAPVHITLADGSVTSVTIFLAEAAETHPGPERLSEWLAGPATFLPVVDTQTERVLWLNRETFRTVRAAASADVDHSVEATIPTEEEVSVHLVDGSVVTGLVTYVLPDRYSRLTDFLNSPHPFLRLVDGADVVFVNRRYVLRVTTSEA